MTLIEKVLYCRYVTNTTLTFQTHGPLNVSLNRTICCLDLSKFVLKCPFSWLDSMYNAFATVISMV